MQLFANLPFTMTCKDNKPNFKTKLINYEKKDSTLSFDSIQVTAPMIKLSALFSEVVTL